MVKRALLGMLVLTAVGIAALVAGLPAPDDSTLKAMETIRAEELKSELDFLASDEMQGRNTNTLFNDIASRYIAQQFEKMGLEPAGDDGTYFQYFSLLQPQLSGTNRLEIRRQEPSSTAGAVLKEDFYPLTLAANAKAQGRVVFAQYGITAPEHDYDDYRGVNAAHKIVMVLDHEPGENDPASPFDGVVDSDYSRTLHKILNAQKHGAIGLILVRDRANHSGEENFSAGARYAWPEDTSRPRYLLKIWADQIRIPAVYASQKIADLLQQGAATAAIQTSLTHDEIRIRNVVGKLAGSDSTLKNEMIVVGAHFDHVGARNGEIYNGADDDASGTVGLIEVAEAFTLSPQRPKRSLLFAAWNAEERGLLGSYYYVERPLVPLSDTVAMFQMDMIGRNEEIPDPANRAFRGFEKQTAEENANSLNILGYSHSEDLKNLAQQNNSQIGLDLKFRYDNHEQNLLRRSDNWPFLTRGVPALFFHTGLHPDYHSPRDTPDKINFPKMEKIVRLVYLCAWSAASSPDRPQLSR